MTQNWKMAFFIRVAKRHSFQWCISVAPHLSRCFSFYVGHPCFIRIHWIPGPIWTWQFWGLIDNFLVWESRMTMLTSKTFSNCFAHKKWTIRLLLISNICFSGWATSNVERKLKPSCHTRFVHAFTALLKKNVHTQLQFWLRQNNNFQ